MGSFMVFTNEYWAHIIGDLDLAFGTNLVDLSPFGFSSMELRLASSLGYQLSYNKNGRMESLLPIHDINLFYATMGSKINNPNIEIIDKTSAEKIHAEMLLYGAEETAVNLATPSYNETVDSQILLFLADISASLKDHG